MGNKGGIAIRFMYRDSSFCFINCHLNAHLENTMRRNQDYHDIARRVQFAKGIFLLYIYLFSEEETYPFALLQQLILQLMSIRLVSN